MTLLEETETRPRSDPGAPLWRPWFGVAVALLCGLLMFAHFGCHGDEDTELLVQWSAN